MQYPPPGSYGPFKRIGTKCFSHVGCTTHPLVALGPFERCSKKVFWGVQCTKHSVVTLEPLENLWVMGCFETCASNYFVDV